MSLLANWLLLFPPPEHNNAYFYYCVNVLITGKVHKKLSVTASDHMPAKRYFYTYILSGGQPTKVCFTHQFLLHEK